MIDDPVDEETLRSMAAAFLLASMPGRLRILCLLERESGTPTRWPARSGSRPRP